MSNPHTNRFAAVGASLIALWVAGCGAEAQDQAAAPPPPEVTVAKPIVRPVDEWSEHTGRFVAAQSVEVRPRVSGYLQRTHFTDGQFVRQGQLLFTIDPLPLQARADRARADVAQANARLSRAESEFKRAEALKAADAISQEEFDTRREAVAQARAALQAAQASFRAENLDLGYTRVYAPISGRVSDRRVDPGNLVQAGETVLTSIVSLNPIHFEFSAPEGLLSGSGGPTLAPGQKRAVAVKLEGEADFLHPGTLDFVDNSISSTSGTIRGRAVFLNGGQFTPGQYGRLRVMAPANSPSVLLPESAINSDQSRKYVLAVNAKNILEYKPVTLGPTVDGLRVVRSGLKGDERVVINGLQRAFPGQPVKPVAGRITPTTQTAAAQAAANAG
jgi:RND family efflux transporter MFP subunit